LKNIVLKSILNLLLLIIKINHDLNDVPSDSGP
jgi:hypothetical protein